jgi:hypothetical protein
MDINPFLYAVTPSIRIKEGRVNPHWACFCSLFGGTGVSLERGKEATAFRCRSPLAFARFYSRTGLLAGGDAYVKICSLCWGALNGAGAAAPARYRPHGSGAAGHGWHCRDRRIASSPHGKCGSHLEPAR